MGLIGPLALIGIVTAVLSLVGRCSAMLLVTALTAGCEQAQSPRPGTDGREATHLRRGLGAEPETLDPQLAADNASLAVLADLFEGLTAESAGGRIVPGAAASWQVSPDGLEWTFQLRAGARWSNGDPLTAQDFATAFQALRAPDTSAPNAGLLEVIEDAGAPEPLMLRLRLRRPCPFLPALLALPVAAPTVARTHERPGSPSNGPFRLREWRRGDRIELERNPHYHAASEVRIERVTYRTVAELATEFNLYRAGELDVTSEVPNAEFGWIRDNLGSQLHVAPYLSTYSYAVNLARLPGADARRALAMSVDRERITRQVTGAGEQPAFGWVPDGVPGYAPARFAWRDLPYTEAVREARLLWEAARARGAAPSAIRLCTDASANHHRTAVALADLWKSALGVETEIVELEWNVYLDTRRHPGDCDLVRFGWSADFVDPEAFLAVFESGHPQDTLGYSSPAYDSLLERSRLEGDSAERMRLLADAEAQLLADLPMIPVFFRVSKQLVKPYVLGYEPNPLGHVPSRYLRIARD